MKTSFLPKGLALKKVVREPKWSDPIAQASINGPEFKVLVDYTAFQGFQDALIDVAKRSQTVKNDEDMKVVAVKPLIEKVLKGWSGATLQNINAILRSDAVIRPESDDPAEMASFIERFVTNQEELPFSPEFAAFVWVNSYEDKLRSRVFLILQNWTDDLTAEVARGKGD